ncbi:hypothetical protein MTX78_09510 [Hymenobacter tibetensis]|uniref:Uncharacterized protein n=1 Tax=Hymenobacter tibetensis TaxID=497967 RepID=A0ABY4D2P9_9BACT|nr:hypothetical protein [Hymenobacter tibetensis]UOG76819.1 hypothetical protein MTX78_09510 [Hymenobacter tibetensis]
MYDSLNARSTLPDEEAEQHLARSPAFLDNDGATDAKGWVRVQRRGMRIDYKPDSRELRVRGSLQTFAQGHNLGTFTAPQVHQACTDLAAYVGLPPDSLRIVGLEAGVNIPVATSPRPFLESLASHKTAPFAATKPPHGATRPLEYGAYHSDYWVKVYDKGKYSQLQGRSLPATGPPHLARYEVVYRRARPLVQLTGLAQLTLADLPKPEVLAVVLADIQRHWNLIQHRHHMQDSDFDGLTFSEAALLAVADNTAFWEAMRKKQAPSTYKRNRARAKELLAQRAEVNPYDDALNKELARLEVPELSPKAKAQI